MSISLVAGLGNPGREYADTRHNLGWVVIDALARQHGLAWQKAARFDAEVARWDSHPADALAGEAADVYERQRHGTPVVRELSQGARDSDRRDLRRSHDRTRRVKVSVTGSAGGHNGVASLLERLGDGFTRYRLGIGPRNRPKWTSRITFSEIHSHSTLPHHSNTPTLSPRPRAAP